MKHPLATKVVIKTSESYKSPLVSNLGIECKIQIKVTKNLIETNIC